MRRSISLDSFFYYNPIKKLISSYGNFLSYCNKNTIILNRIIRKKALWLYLNNV